MTQSPPAEIVLFYSTFSKSCGECIDIMKWLNKTPAKPILRAVRLDSVATRTAAKRGKWFSVRGVPTVVVSSVDGNIQVFEGAPKAGAWLTSFAEAVGESVAASRTPQLTPINRALTGGGGSGYVPPPYPTGSSEEDNPYILKSDNGSRLQFKQIATGPQRSDDGAREVSDRKLARHIRGPINTPPPTSSPSGIDEMIDGETPLDLGGAPPPKVYMPDFANGNIGATNTSTSDKAKTTKKPKSKKSKKSKKHRNDDEDYEMFDEDNEDDGVDLQFIEGDAPTRPPTDINTGMKKVNRNENMSSLIQKAQGMAKAMTTQYGYDNNEDG